MAITVEKPRLPLENTGEQHLACAVLIDTSGSMAGYEGNLKEAIAAMKQAIENDDIARGRVEICLIAFDDNVKELSPFGPIGKLEVPGTISCGGMTHTHEAIEFALRRVAERKEDYKKNGVTYNQPWLWLLTDGGSNDADNGSFQALLEMQKNKKCVFFGVAVGNQVNETELAGMHKNGMVFRVGKDNLAAAFEYISQSVSIASQREPGSKVNLDKPNNGMTVDFITIDA